MKLRWGQRTCLGVLLGLAAAGPSWASDEPAVYTDPGGDAVLRRTDPGADGPVNQASRLPDLKTMTLGGWTTPTPTTNPYNGAWKDPRSANLLRIDIEFKGLVNPPGPLNLLGDGFDPYRYGPNPVFGFVEFDADREPDTGGQVDYVRNHVLGNVSRFGGALSDSIGERAAVTAADFDGNLLTSPLVERSGEEFQLSFCSCFSFTINTQGDATPATFDAGDTWILTGRFFQRIDAFSEYSSAFNGSKPGMYDPTVNVRFKHDTATDRTMISLVYGITNAGSAALKGQSTQGNDFNVANQTSVDECLSEIRFAAQNNSDGPNTPYALLKDWSDSNHSDFADFLDPTRWRIKAIVGTSYSAQQTGANYVWTDVGPDFEFGDCNFDGFTNAGDLAVLRQAVAQSDGGTADADGAANGQFSLASFGENFALYDFDYNGFINALDFDLYGTRQKGDVNFDGVLNAVDQALVGNMLGSQSGQALYNPAGDFNADGKVDGADQRWLSKRIRLDRAGQ